MLERGLLGNKIRGEEDVRGKRKACITCLLAFHSRTHTQHATQRTRSSQRQGCKTQKLEGVISSQLRLLTLTACSLSFFNLDFVLKRGVEGGWKGGGRGEGRGEEGKKGGLSSFFYLGVDFFSFWR